MWTPAAERELLSKVTWRLVPFVSLLYCMAFLDRVNIANAHNSLRVTIGITEHQYSNASSIFFLGYCLFELPSNLLLHQVQPRIWIARIFITWGLVTLCFAFVSSYTGLLVARFFLGVAEAGFFPGMVYYFSNWFTPEEIALRVSMFFSASAAAGMLGGLVSYGVLQLDGRAGLYGWQWLYLVEGIPTMLVGFSVYWLLPNGPTDCGGFLTAAEAEYLVARLRSKTAAVVPSAHVDSASVSDFVLMADADEHGERPSGANSARHGPRLSVALNSASHATGTASSSPAIQWADVKATLCNPLLWLIAVLDFAIITPLYSISFFLPAIIGEFGYSPLTSNALTVPVYLVAGIITVAVAWSSERRKERYFHMIVPSCFAFVFFIVFASVLSGSNTTLKLFILIALVSCVWCVVSIVFGLLLSVLHSSLSTATGTALVVSVANIGGYAGPALCAHSSSADGTYALACTILAGFCALQVVLLFVLRRVLPEPGAQTRHEAEDSSL
jgi:sugar phosphate permease